MAENNPTTGNYAPSANPSKPSAFEYSNSPSRRGILSARRAGTRDFAFCDTPQLAEARCAAKA